MPDEDTKLRALNRHCGNLLSGPSSRWLALGITVLVLTVGWFAAIVPLIEWHAERKAEIEHRFATSARMEAVTQTLPDLRRATSYHSPEDMVPGSAPSSFIDGATDAIAAASLQQIVQDLAGGLGATVVSAETLPSSQIGVARKIGLRVSIKVSWTVLVRLFQRMHQHPPRLLVDDLKIHSAQPIQTAANPDGESNISADFTVFTFRTDMNATLPAGALAEPIIVSTNQSQNSVGTR